MEGYNGEDVDEEDDHAGNCNRTGKVPHRVLYERVSFFHIITLINTGRPLKSKANAN